MGSGKWMSLSGRDSMDNQAAEVDWGRRLLRVNTVKGGSAVLQGTKRMPWRRARVWTCSCRT